MAVQPQTPYKEYTANGSTKSFSLGFDCESQDHLIVLVDDVEPVIGTWSLSSGAVVFGTAPTTGKKITIQRNTPFRRDEDFQSYDNSFRPPGVNKGFDKIWLKLQELGVADWILSNRIDALKAYVDDRDDELRAYLLEEIRKQGVALDQLDDYYNYLMQRLAQVAIDRGWAASFIVSADGSTQQEINDFGGAEWWDKPLGYKLGATVKLTNGDIVKSTAANNIINPNIDMTGWVNTNAASHIETNNNQNQQFMNNLMLDFASCSDLADFYSKREVLATFIKKSSSTSFELLKQYAMNRAVQYAFTTDADGLTRLTSAKIGRTISSESVSNLNTVVKSGTFTDSGSNNLRTEVVGDSFTGQFTGTGFKFRARCDNRGGMWRFVIDGTITKDISVYSTTTIDSSDLSVAIPVIDGLTRGNHTFIATFTGDDPLNPPSTAPSRGWLKYNETTNVTIPVLDVVINLAPSDDLKSPNLPIVGVGSAGNYYTTVIGDSMTFSFTGTGFILNHYADNRGGVWRFVIDGVITKDISTFGTGGQRKTTVVSDLENKLHNITMTFTGQDPANPVASPRGWYEYNSASPTTFQILPRVPSQTEEMLAVSSVLEYAISTRPESQPSMEATWTPIHSGRSGVSRNITKTLKIDGVSYTSIDSAINSLAYKAINSFELIENFTTYNANDVSGSYPIFATTLSYQDTNRGSILHKQKFKAMNDIRILDGYVTMLGARTIVDKIESSAFEAYNVADSGTRVEYKRPPTGLSASFTSDRYIFITQSKTPYDSYNLGGNNNPVSFTNIRSDATKSYLQGFKTNSVFKKDSELNNVVEYLATEY